MITLKIDRDPIGTPIYDIPITDAGYKILLPVNDNTGATVATITVPAGATKVIPGYSTGNDYWISNADFTIPSSPAQSFTAQNVFLNPPPLQVVAGATLYIRSVTSCALTLAFYS